MPVELQDFPEIPRPPHQVRNSKYSWDDLFNGSVWAMKEGEDFKPRLRVFRQQVLTHAARHGYEVEVKSDLVNKILYLRARKSDAPKAPPLVKPKSKTPGLPKMRSGTVRETAEAPRVAEPPQSVDPVSVVFGDRMEQGVGGMKPPPPKPVPGFVFGEPRNGKDWD